MRVKLFMETERYFRLYLTSVAMRSSVLVHVKRLELVKHTINYACLCPHQLHQHHHQVKFPYTVPLPVLSLPLHHTSSSVQLCLPSFSSLTVPARSLHVPSILYHYLDKTLPDSFLCLSNIESAFLKTSYSLSK